MSILSTIKAIAKDVFAVSLSDVVYATSNYEAVVQNGKDLMGVATRVLVIDREGQPRPVFEYVTGDNGVLERTYQVAQEGDYIMVVKTGRNIQASELFQCLSGKIYPCSKLDLHGLKLTIGLDQFYQNWLHAGTDMPSTFPIGKHFDPRYHVKHVKPASRKERLIADLNSITREMLQRNGVNAANAAIKQLHRIKDFIEGNDIKSEPTHETRSGRITKSDLDPYTGTRPAPDSWDSI